MSVKIQGITFHRDEIIVSVGFFLAGDFDELRKVSPKYVEDYEPLESAYIKHLEKQESLPTLICYNEAVSSFNGNAYLEERSTKSTICSADPDALKIKTLVKVISMKSILERVTDIFGQIDKLLINCEGSEIEIIKNTPMTLFRKCKYIFVQFHPFVKFLDISEDDVKECMTKLKEEFVLSRSRHRDFKLKYSKYGFIRKDKL